VLESVVLIGLTITALWGFHQMFTGDTIAPSLAIGITLILPLISILFLNQKMAISSTGITNEGGKSGVED
jgi:hypothetical protein